MGEGLLRKDFQLSPGDWSDDTAETIEAFFEEIVARHVTLKTGSYVGTGKELVVEIKDLPGSPKLLAVQPEGGGTVFVTLVAVPGTDILKWTNKAVTIKEGASINVQNARYRFLILA